MQPQCLVQSGSCCLARGLRRPTGPRVAAAVLYFLLALGHILPCGCNHLPFIHPLTAVALCLPVPDRNKHRPPREITKRCVFTKAANEVRTESGMMAESNRFDILTAIVKEYQNVRLNDKRRRYCRATTSRGTRPVSAGGGKIAASKGLGQPPPTRSPSKLENVPSQHGIPAPVKAIDGGASFTAEGSTVVRKRQRTAQPLSVSQGALSHTLESPTPSVGLEGTSAQSASAKREARTIQGTQTRRMRHLPLPPLEQRYGVGLKDSWTPSPVELRLGRPRRQSVDTATLDRASFVQYMEGILRQQQLTQGARRGSKGHDGEDEQEGKEEDNVKEEGCGSETVKSTQRRTTEVRPFDVRTKDLSTTTQTKRPVCGGSHQENDRDVDDASCVSSVSCGSTERCDGSQVRPTDNGLVKEIGIGHLSSFRDTLGSHRTSTLTCFDSLENSGHQQESGVFWLTRGSAGEDQRRPNGGGNKTTTATQRHPSRDKSALVLDPKIPPRPPPANNGLWRNLDALPKPCAESWGSGIHSCGGVESNDNTRALCRGGWEGDVPAVDTLDFTALAFRSKGARKVFKQTQRLLEALCTPARGCLVDSGKHSRRSGGGNVGGHSSIVIRHNKALGKGAAAGIDTAEGGPDLDLPINARTWRVVNKPTDRLARLSEVFCCVRPPHTLRIECEIMLHDALRREGQDQEKGGGGSGGSGGGGGGDRVAVAADKRRGRMWDDFVLAWEVRGRVDSRDCETKY